MKNKIASYNNFINEAKASREILPDRILPSTDREDYLRLRHQFYESLIDLTEYYKDSYSDLAPTTTDPDDDYREIMNLLSKKGWGITSIKNLFSEKADELCKYGFFDFVEGELPFDTKIDSNFPKYYEVFRSESLGNINGYIDILLYKLVEELNLKGGKIYLGGKYWGFDSDQNEYLIKCSYGYHQTKYGQLYLKNRGVSEKELVENAKNDLINWIKDTSWNSILYTPDAINRVTASDIPFDDYCVEEEERIVIYTGEVIDKAKELGNKYLTIDVLISNIHRYLDNFGLQIIVSENKREVVIYLQPDESH